MTDDASLTDFLDDASDEREGGDGSHVDTRAADTGTADEPTERAGGDDAAADDLAADDHSADGADGTDDDADGTADDESVPDTGPEGDDDRVPPETVEPASVTAAWSPDGVACDDCGSVVQYRWEGEAGLVCPDCKEW